MGSQAHLGAKRCGKAEAEETFHKHASSDWLGEIYSSEVALLSIFISGGKKKKKSQTLWHSKYISQEHDCVPLSDNPLFSLYAENQHLE